MIQVAGDVSAEEAEEIVGHLWSAQYRAPGTLCAFGGAQLADDVGSSATSSQYTHAVRFRFGSQAAADSFLSSATVQTCLTTDLASKLQSRKLVLFEGRVASDLEAIFCRGSEWNSGAEHIFIFKATPRATFEEVDQHLTQLAALAESSLAGALQTTHGKIWSSEFEDSGGTHAMLTRFETQKQLQAFLRLPPCAALLSAVNNSPVSALVSFAYNIAPPNDSRSTSPRSNLL
ncbi:g2491 [Coccomyxa elongata]